MTATNTETAQHLEDRLQQQLGLTVYGLNDIIHALTIALIGGGHVLLEGPPGLGKTLLSNRFADILGGEFKRVQGTADLMPADVTGVHVLDTRTTEFAFHPGPLFADIVLVDEINRASPRTQSALLEAMQERHVTVDGERFSLPQNFLVVATQNPHEFEGTYPLPESQLDRFMLCVPMSYPSREQEARILDAYAKPDVSAAKEVPTETVESALIDSARNEAAQVHFSQALTGYALDLITATRQSTSIGLGLSSRAALALVRAARIEAALRGGDYAIPDDIKRVAPWVIPHRLVLAPTAVLDGLSAESELTRILETIPVPRETADE